MSAGKIKQIVIVNKMAQCCFDVSSLALMFVFFFMINSNLVLWEYANTEKMKKLEMAKRISLDFFFEFVACSPGVLEWIGPV